MIYLNFATLLQLMNDFQNLLMQIRGVPKRSLFLFNKQPFTGTAPCRHFPSSKLTIGTLEQGVKYA